MSANNPTPCFMAPARQKTLLERIPKHVLLFDAHVYWKSIGFGIIQRSADNARIFTALAHRTRCRTRAHRDGRDLWHRCAFMEGRAAYQAAHHPWARDCGTHRTIRRRPPNRLDWPAAEGGRSHHLEFSDLLRHVLLLRRKETTYPLSAPPRLWHWLSM